MSPSEETDGRPGLVIIGTGAMACLFGARLARLADVTLLGSWPRGLEALRREGIRLRDRAGERVVPVRALGGPAGVKSRLALVLVKSHQTRRAAAWAAEVLTPEGVAVTLQNGLGNLQQLAEATGTHRAALGVTMQGATLLGPGHVSHGGDGPTALGCSAATKPRLLELAKLLRRAGFQTELTDNLEGLVWGKLVINSAVNPVTALLRVHNGALLHNPDARALLLAAVRETARVAEGAGHSLPYPDPAEQVIDAIRATSRNHSSMLQDVLRGSPTEIEALNGAVVQAARQIGMDAPVNETLLRLVRALEAGAGEQQTGCRPPDL